MEYSANQINNLLRTYPQHLKVRPTLRDKETHISYDPSSVDRVTRSMSSMLRSRFLACMTIRQSVGLYTRRRKLWNIRSIKLTISCEPTLGT